MKSTPGDSTDIPTRRVPRYFALVLLLIPVLFFMLLEGALSLANYGSDDRQWIEVAGGKKILNPVLGKRYFRTVQNIPISNQDVFDAEKKSGVFRVFVLGGSSAAGYPFTPAGSFPRWLRTQLSLLYPNCTIEIINLSMTAVNSYTLLDLFPGVLNEHPDLILIYAGHNEYYGALGVGSAESAGATRSIVRLSLFLDRFRTYQLLRKALAVLSSLVAGSAPTRQDGTLMSRMARDQYIALGSETYASGLSQFKENVGEILGMARNQRVPVILGTVVSNIKDHRPFVSLDGVTRADTIYSRAQRAFMRGGFRHADSLFRLAKDHDALRFRAPEEMNVVIRSLAQMYGAYIADIESAFVASSFGGIVGNDLMTDHLHPNLAGYRLMSDTFLAAMMRYGLLPDCPVVTMLPDTLAIQVVHRIPITRLDSVLGRYRILVLKNDWPYVEKKEKRPESELMTPKDPVEQAAFDVIADKENWESAHRKVAGWHLSRKDYPLFLREMDVLISQYPLVVEYYDFVANELLKVEQYEHAKSYISRRYALAPDAFSSKWLGIIGLSKKETDSAIQYLEESLFFDGTDPQVLYNLAGAYSYAGEYAKALSAVNRCLARDTSYPRAHDLKMQLERAAR